MLTDDERDDLEGMIEHILATSIPDPIESWGMTGPHSIGCITTTGRYFIVHVTPIPGLFMVEEFDPMMINSLLN